MENYKILIVEDEEKLSRVLQLELQYENYNTAIADNGTDALIKILDETWDLVLLDIMIPELSGLEVLRRVRREGNQVPIILLTARDMVHDKVSGLDLGANDYVTKPFQIEELLARIRTQLRSRPQAEERQQLIVGDLMVDQLSHEVKRDNKIVELTPREFELLVYLLENKNIVLTREQILENVWGYDYFGDTNVVDVYIRYLRQKLDKGYDIAYIQTIRGVGYTIKDV
ncbi:MAG TPA: response regulator transcription factor [Pseudogracilibacillus sp.]|nr:response regulator transcription factor [Pseudogracilibacillus sp.]